MRVLLLTGKGGVGKSTHALALGAWSARSGRRTLVMSTDAAHSLADAYGVVLGAGPTEVAPGLHLHHVDAQARFERSWAQVQGYLTDLLRAVEVDPVVADEITVLPGAEEVLALLELRELARTGEWETIVVDCAPTAETLRLLALPEALGWYVSRVLPAQRRVVRALRPVLTRVAGVPMPEEPVWEALVRLHAELGEVHALLSGPDASVRIVLTPEQVVLAEARRSWTTLSLFGYRVDGVIANRVFPAATTDPWVEGWVRAQRDVLAEIDDSFAGVPVWRAAYAPGEPVGHAASLDLADELYGGADPLAPPAGRPPLDLRREGGATVVALRLPLVEADGVRLARDGDDLVVSVGSYRRLLALPAALARSRVAGARVRDGELQVRFVHPGDGEGE